MSQSLNTSDCTQNESETIISNLRNDKKSNIHTQWVANSREYIQDSKSIIIQNKMGNKDFNGEYEQPIIEGWLYKWTNMVNNWRPRYFKLYIGVLCYVKGSKIRKKKYLTHKICYIDIYTSKCNKISIRYPRNSVNDIHLRTYTFESKLTWINALFYSMNLKTSSFEKGFVTTLNTFKPQLPLTDSITTETLSFLPNLLYELIKVRSLVLDELSEKKTRKLKNKTAKCFDKLIGAVFDLTYKNLNLGKYCEVDIYSPLFKSISPGSCRGLDRNNTEELTYKESNEDLYFDAYSDFENDDQINQISKYSILLPKKSDCIYCFWKKNPHKYRAVLPYLQQKPRFNLWTYIKESITKDISRITIPIQFNEPTSLLQRLSEDFRYSSILESATFLNSSIDRLREITIFSITPYASSIGRVFKPFNPLLGETYEFSHRGFRFVAEQVGHHPPTTAFHVEHHPTDFGAEIPKVGHKNKPLYCAWGEVGNKSRFSGQSLELSILGNVNITLNENNDHYTFNRPKLLIHNIIFGKVWIEIIGVSTIINHSTSEFSLIEYQKSGWFGSDLFNIKGLVFNKDGIPVYKIGGKWDTKIWYETCSVQEDSFYREINAKIDSDLRKGSQVTMDNFLAADNYKSSDTVGDLGIKNKKFYLHILSNWDRIETVKSSYKVGWIAERKPSQSDKFFGFTDMSFELNEISPQYDNSIPGVIMPCTDSRFRPDQRAYENGNVEWAIKEKRRLEEKQRAEAKKRTNGEADYSPMWFSKEFDGLTGECCWKYNDKYWIHKDKQIDFEDLPNIF
ncbi:oxysterol-binding protein [Cryptosporidium felis]|nr:oxysterol-binding protein [Cryptosporidium felis]